MTLKQLCTEWLDVYHKDSIRIQTYNKYSCVIRNYINPFIGDKNIKSFDKREILFFMNHLKTIKGQRTKKKLSPAIINGTLTVLKLVFKYAVDFNLLKIDPTHSIKRVREERLNNIKCFTIDEQKKIEEYCLSKNSISYLSIVFDLYTGLRIGELLALTWDDIDIKKKTISINKTTYFSKDFTNKWVEIINSPKTSSSIREIPIIDYLLDLLLRYKDKYESNQIFCLENGSHFQTRLLRFRYNKMLDELNIRHLNFHSLRHTFATRALELGIDVRTVADILGHKDAKVTLNTYAHSLSEQKIRAMSLFNTLLNR